MKGLELTYEVLKWILAGLGVAALICFLTACFLSKATDMDPMPLFGISILLMFLMIPVATAQRSAESKLQPQCPNCEKAVASAFCPDCGWEAAEEQASICEACGAEWDSAFCGDCGAPMDQAN